MWKHALTHTRTHAHTQIHTEREGVQRPFNNWHCHARAPALGNRRVEYKWISIKLQIVFTGCQRFHFSSKGTLCSAFLRLSLCISFSQFVLNCVAFSWWICSITHFWQPTHDRILKFNLPCQFSWNYPLLLTEMQCGTLTAWQACWMHFLPQTAFAKPFKEYLKLCICYYLFAAWSLCCCGCIATVSVHANIM